MSWKDKFVGAFVEDDGKDAKKPAAPLAATPAPGFQFPPNFTGAGNFGATATAPAMNSPFSIPSNIVPDEAMYQRILKATDFDQSAVGKAVHKYYDALPASLDNNTRFKAALAQAATLDKITSDQVLLAFDQLKQALADEGRKFGSAVANQTTKEVVGRQQNLDQINNQITQLTKQIADLQTQHTQISAELADATNKIANNQQQFTLASDRRGHELDQQKATFAALLQ